MFAVSLYVAVTVFAPRGKVLVERLALPPASVTVPRVVAPDVKVTVPVAITPVLVLTVARKVTNCPNVEGLADDANAVVLEA
jgi:hypothetical protein